MFATPLEQRIIAIVTPPLAAMGYALVRAKLKDSKPRSLEIMAERADGRGMSIDDCTAISERISAVLDVEDPITGAYALEVCSPGLDRPLSTPEDFQRFTGHDAKVETQLPVEGRKNFRGQITAADDDTVTITLPEGKAYALNYANLRTAKLVPQVPGRAAKPSKHPKKKAS